MLRLATTLGALLLASNAASAVEKLYKEYEFGTSKAQLAAQVGVHPCDLGALCLEGQSFAGQDTSLVFRFENDMLTSVVLDFSENPEGLELAFGSVFSTLEWSPIIAISPSTSEVLDLVPTAKSLPGAPTKEDFYKFILEGLSTGVLELTLVEITPELSAATTKTTNLMELMRDLPENARLMEVILDDQSSEYYIHFFLPQLHAVTFPSEAVEEF